MIISAVFALVLAAGDAPTLSPESSESIVRIVTTEMARLEIPGLSLAFALDNALCFSRAFGYADLENLVPAQTTTAYRTASIAKAITATALMQLVEHGQIDLDAPIQEFCPEFPEKPWPVTVRAIATHTSGIRHYKSNAEATATAHFFLLADTLPLFADDPLQHEPGAQYTYSTFAFTLLGRAIEQAAEMDFGSYLARRVFGPAGMLHSGVDDQWAIIPGRARGYRRLEPDDLALIPQAARGRYHVGQLVNASLHDTSMKVPGGGLLTTADDLVRFAIAVNTGALVSAETRQQMWTPGRTADGKETSYGLGWFLSTRRGERQVSHDGGQAGTRTALTLLPDRGLAIAALCNLERADLETMMGQIQAILVRTDQERREAAAASAAKGGR